ncbi:MAG TPA: LPS assembly lipoprotein LptE [Azospirillaceae bacterium]|nr:LPS assembly lipoprotein LptE [Azospirillaceae bacterium]
MSWSRRRLLSAAALSTVAAAASACGLRPLYGERGVTASAKEQLTRVRIENIPERSGQILRNELIDRFYAGNGPGDSAYRLNVSLSISETRTVIRADDTSLRRLVTAVARYQLQDAGTGGVVTSGTLSTSATFPFQEAQYGILVARETVTRDLLVALADDITTRVALYFVRET